MILPKSVFVSTGFQILGKVLSAGIAIITISLLSRFLTQEMFAVYGTLYSIVAVFASIADMGIYTMVLRDMNMNKKKEIEYYHTGITLRLLLSLLILGLGAFFVEISSFYSSFLFSGIWIVALGTFLVLFSGIVSVVLQHSFSMHYATFSLIIGKIITFLGILWVVFFEKVSSESFFFILLIGVLGNLVMTLFLLFFSEKKSPFGLCFKKKELITLFFKVLPLGGSTILSMLYFQMGMLSFRFFLEGDVITLAESHYFIIIRIIEVLMTFPTFFMVSLLPMLASAISKNNKEEQSQIVSQGFSMVFMIAFPFVLCLQLFSSQIVSILAPDSYLVSSAGIFFASDIALLFLAVAMGIAFLNIFLSYIFIALGLQSILLKRNFFLVFIQISFLSFLVPSFGILGASISSLTVEMLVFLWGFWFLKKKISMILSFLFFKKIILLSFFCFIIGILLKSFFLSFFGILLGTFILLFFLLLIFIFGAYKIGMFTPEIKKIFLK